MGGLWTDQATGMTNIPGLFAAGEVDYQYHGANRLGANSLLSCIHGGLYVAGPSALKFAKESGKSSGAVKEDVFRMEVARQTDRYNKTLHAQGSENPYALWLEMGSIMTDNVTVVRYNDKLAETDKKLQELMHRYNNISVPDHSGWTNQSLFFARQLWNMLVLARVITIGALMRDESRGAHYKPDYPERNDARFLKTTRAKYVGPTAPPEITYEDVDIQYIKPRPRRYDVDKSAVTAATGSTAPAPVAAGTISNGSTAIPGTGAVVVPGRPERQ
jgi:succinate dehydrogenase / fumarate reductase flavoprotein subunit